MSNPFKYGCVVRGDNFCPREDLEKTLQNYARSGQNVVIQGERRMGKTSLVKKAIEDLRGVKLLYIDLYAIRNLSDFCRRVMIGVTGVSKEFSFLKKAMGFLTSLRPTMSLDTLTGSPSISLDARASNEPNSLRSVMDAIENLAREYRLCVVFDEVQDILKMAEGPMVLAEMRSTIQFQDEIPYFFLGSIRNDMIHIFTDPDSPFFKSALPFEVGPIDERQLGAFLKRRFTKGNRRIGEDAIAAIIHFAAGVTGDVQELCEALWEITETGAEITGADLPRAMELIYAREIRGYEASVDPLSPIQLATLKALAQTGLSEVCGKDFMEAVGVTNPSVVKRAITRLLADRLIFLSKGEYRFVNPFFREWLKR